MKTAFFNTFPRMLILAVSLLILAGSPLILAGSPLILAGSPLILAGSAACSNEIRKVLLHQQSRIELSPLKLYSLAISPDAAMVAGSQQNRTVLFWDMEGKTVKRHILDEYTPVPLIMRFSPDLQELATAPENGYMRIYPLKENAAPYSLRWSERTTAMAFSPSGRNLAVGSQSGEIALWDYRARRLLKVMLGHDFFVSTLAFSPDGKRLASGSWDRSIKIWDAATGKMENSFSTTSGPQVLTLSALKPVVTPGGDKQSHNASQDSVRKDQAVTSLLYCPDGSHLACGLKDGTLELWDLSTGKVSAHTRLQSQIVTIAFSPDGSLCAAGHNDGSVTVACTTALSESFTILGHHAQVQSLLFSGRGEILYSGGRDGVVAIWKVERQ
ncbi:MAG: WD40 repeat domain-containing protein [Candidatus Xenobiia bacterium LiM19]